MKPPETFVGLWDGHDAGAALVVDGRVELAVNEERLSGRKLEVGWPTQSLAQIRRAAASRWTEAHFAISTSDPAKTLTRLLPGAKERYYQLRRRLTAPRWSDGLTRSLKYRLTQWPTCPALMDWTRGHTARTLGVAPERVSVVDHHEAHAATAAYWTDWDTDALIVTLDGIGDGLSGSVWRLSSPDGALAPLLRLPGAASLGLFFEHVTEALQMRALEDEGKVMALASFSAELPAAKNPFAAWFRLEPRSTGELPRLVCAIPPQRMRREVDRVVWRLPREQVCRAAQSVLEQIVPAFFSALSEATGVRCFGYAGGVASNIKVNRLVRLLPGVERLAICPAMGDGGLALGAAWAAWRRIVGRRPTACPDFRLGLDRGDLGEGVEKLLQPGENLVRPRDPAEDAAALVTAGEVIMWAQGRMELGARALGARSIVARADSETARDALNLRLKRRVWFQPFCPTLLDSEAPRLLADFRGKNDVNRHMTMGFQTTPAGKAALAGAIGPDASCRPQMVADESPDPWARLLHAVKARTGVGAVINTSLNLHGKPMPDSPADILAAWRESGVRHLVLGRARLSREGPA